MYVVKRDGRREGVKFDKIMSRLLALSKHLEFINPSEIAIPVIQGLYPGVTTMELDTLAAEIAASMTTRHPHYERLAARLAISNLHKKTQDMTFSRMMNALPNISKETLDLVNTYADRLDAAIVDDRDFLLTYFGFKTLEKSYLLTAKPWQERPQYLFMRVAVGIHQDLEAVLQTYRALSLGWFIHATPTLFHAGTQYPQLSSCFLLAMRDDSVSGIFDTLKQCALISKMAGGIGLHVHGIRASGSAIGDSGGVSNGLVPMLRVFNNTARYIDQGGNKRPGAFAVYLEPWHADIFAFLDLKKNTGKEEQRARDLFYGLWIPDLFMERVASDSTWCLMCPQESPGLEACWGDTFHSLYTTYEKEGRFRKRIQARQLWHAIIASQIETGTPYMLYKDACNRKSNQQHLGTIQGSNLCTEIVEYTSPEEVAVCNLASVALSRFVHDGLFQFQTLKDTVKILTVNLNRIIDLNVYPVPEAKASNLKHRPIGIGVQGLADAFILMRYPFDSDEAQRLNRQIFETIYYAALEASCELAEKDGPYASYQGSPASQGILQYDMWGVRPSSLWDWSTLKRQIAAHGLRNSLLVALMPTASTAHILGNHESFEPYTSNVYTRRVLAGEYQVVNRHLLRDLTHRGLWNERMRHRLLSENGSVQQIDQIPEDLKKLYRTVWEIPQKHLVKMAADRAPFIDQSQSMTIYMAEPTYAKMTSMHFYGWKLGLKTGMYYLRSKPAANAIPFTVDRCLACES